MAAGSAANMLRLSDSVLEGWQQVVSIILEMVVDDRHCPNSVHLEAISVNFIM